MPGTGIDSFDVLLMSSSWHFPGQCRLCASDGGTDGRKAEGQSACMLASGESETYPSLPPMPLLCICFALVYYIARLPKFIARLVWR